MIQNYNRVAGRPDFKAGDVALICKHIYEDATKGNLSIQWQSVKWEGRFEPRQEFTRSDGTKGLCAFLIACADCAKLGKEVDYVEEIWQGGKFHVADFARGLMR